MEPTVEVFHAGEEMGRFWPDAEPGYEPIIRGLRDAGQEVWAHGFFERTWDGKNDAYVTIPVPGLLADWLAASPSERSSLPRERIDVYLKRSGDYQREMAGILNGRSEASVVATIRVDATPTGRYAGQPALRFIVDGVTVGVIPAQFRPEAEDLFSAALNDDLDIEVRLFRYRDCDRFGALVQLAC